MKAHAVPERISLACTSNANPASARRDVVRQVSPPSLIRGLYACQRQSRREDVEAAQEAVL